MIYAPLLILFSVLATVAIILLLFYKGDWDYPHALSIGLGLLFAFIFFAYGVGVLQTAFPWLDAFAFFFIWFFGQWLGAGIVASIPLWLDQNYDDAFDIIKMWLLFGYVYVVADLATGSGPPALGPYSPYRQKGGLLGLSPACFAEDVPIGVFLQVIGVDPFSDLAVLIGYYVIPIILIASLIIFLGFRKVEKLIFEEL